MVNTGFLFLVWFSSSTFLAARVSQASVQGQSTYLVNLTHWRRTPSGAYVAHGGPTISVFPIWYAFPLESMVREVPRVKRLAFAAVIPNQVIDAQSSTASLRFPCTDEGERQYFDHYSHSYYAFTTMKGGWSALRHYEILAHGAIPYFPNLQHSPAFALWKFPRAEVLEASSLPGLAPNIEMDRYHVSIRSLRDKPTINFSVFPVEKYFELATRILNYTRQHLTTVSLARYFLSSLGYSETATPNVLMLLPQSHGAKTFRAADYQFLMLFHGLRKLLGARVVETPRLWFMYPTDDNQRAFTRKQRNAIRKGLYGCGFSYAFTLPADDGIVRAHLAERIRIGQFDLIVYTLYKPDQGWDLPFWKEVVQKYRKEQIVLLDAQDAVDWWCRQTGLRTWCHRAWIRNRMLLRYHRFGNIFRTEPT